MHAAVVPHLVDRLGRGPAGEQAVTGHGALVGDGHGAAREVQVGVTEVLQQVLLAEVLPVAVRRRDGVHQPGPACRVPRLDRPPGHGSIAAHGADPAPMGAWEATGYPPAGSVTAAWPEARLSFMAGREAFPPGEPCPPGEPRPPGEPCPPGEACPPGSRCVSARNTVSTVPAQAAMARAMRSVARLRSRRSKNVRDAGTVRASTIPAAIATTSASRHQV